MTGPHRKDREQAAESTATSTTHFGFRTVATADKTQLVTLLFAADREVSKWVVFFGSASALVVASAIGVLAGHALSQFINMKMMSLIAGAGFMLIGAWTLYHGLKIN